MVVGFIIRSFHERCSRYGVQSVECVIVDVVERFAICHQMLLIGTQVDCVVLRDNLRVKTQK